MFDFALFADDRPVLHGGRAELGDPVTFKGRRSFPANAKGPWASRGRASPYAG